MADHPLRTAAANLWHRRWTLALLWALISLVMIELARATFPVNYAIFRYLSDLGVWGFLHAPKLHVVITAVMFSYFWFRICLLRPPDTRGVPGDLRCLLGRPRDALRFAAYAAAFLAVTGFVYLVSLVVVSRLTRSSAGLPLLEDLGIFGSAGTVTILGFLACVPLALLAPMLVSSVLVVASSSIGRSLSFAEARGMSDAGQRSSAALLVLVFGLLLSYPATRLIPAIAAHISRPDEPVLMYASFVARSAILIAPSLVVVAILVELVCGLYRKALSDGNSAEPKLDRKL